MITKASAHTAAFFLALCSWQLAAGQVKDTNDAIDRRMQAIAGEKAGNCGHVEPDANPEPALKCARNAIKRKRPFFVRLDGNGIEGLVSHGFAGNGTGSVYSLDFDSYTCRDASRSPDRCPNVGKCPTPVRLFYYSDAQRHPYGFDCVPLKNEKS